MPLRIDILTLFPKMLDGFLSESILGKALERKLLEVTAHDLRRWCTDKHRTADDRPFGGGAGMILKPEPAIQAIEKLQTPGCQRIYLTPDGEPFRDSVIDREISIGDYVLTNGTLPAAVMVDALARFIPGVLGDEKSLTHESFTGKLLDFPQYTRPAEFRGMSVPDVLQQGNHGEIDKWRTTQSIEKTRQVRPDLFKKYRHESDH